ncbi:unnamed protein product [Adineta ricciae]|uniref:Uncharacterized protein n=1 Tax=Adineta ricciae TaxID=249248 RepID=A0A815GMU0_ADIRI|nr:unnamed protein product [Adineta ricciae]CAF1359236.1 unnamed protein product [Adineta ricciae]
MNWTVRRPFREQFAYDIGRNRHTNHRVLPYQVHKTSTNQPIDALRLELADCRPPYPVHNPRRDSYIRTFPERRSTIQRTNSSSIRSVSTFETDLVHQRVSTIRSYPSPTSIFEREEVINELDEPNNDRLLTIEQPLNKTTDELIEEESSSQCRTCLMLMEIIDHQTQQIRQCTEQISQQADLLAKLGRRLAGIEEGIDDQKAEQTTTTSSADK